MGETAKAVLVVTQGGQVAVVFLDKVYSIMHKDTLVFVVIPPELAQKAYPRQFLVALNDGPLQKRVVDWPLNPEFAVVKERVPVAMALSRLRDALPEIKRIGGVVAWNPLKSKM